MYVCFFVCSCHIPYWRWSGLGHVHPEYVLAECTQKQPGFWPDKLLYYVISLLHCATTIGLLQLHNKNQYILQMHIWLPENTLVMRWWFPSHVQQGHVLELVNSNHHSSILMSRAHQSHTVTLNKTNITAPTGNRTQGKCLEGIYVTTTPSAQTITTNPTINIYHKFHFHSQTKNSCWLAIVIYA